MKSNKLNPAVINFNCTEHKEKCSFVCLLKSCNNAFKIGCSKCKKDHAQHPNRLIPIADFHTMLGKPIKYLQDVSAFKLMNLKKKIQFIRNFRGYILQKEIQLIQSNKNIKQIVSSLLDEHYVIRDTVSHLDNDSLINHHQQYIASLSKCKQFMAYNPVKCQLVFNNEVIKNSRISLEKQIKSSHELIDNIRQFLVKIIEVLLANCAHDEDDEDIQFIQEGDDKTNFNIYIKNRIDVIENPNIKSKLEHSTFLQMFDEEKEALTKEVELLEKQITNKSTILKKIKSLSCKDPQQIISPTDKSKSSFNSNDVIQNLHYQNEQLRGQISFMKKQSNLEQNEDLLMNDKLSQIKKFYQEEVSQRSQEINKVKHYCHDLQQRLQGRQNQGKHLKERFALSEETLKKYQSQLDKERSHIRQLKSELNKISKAHQQKIKQFKVQNHKFSEEIASYQKKIKTIQAQLKRKREECETYKANKTNLDQKISKHSQIEIKYNKMSEQLAKRQKQISKLHKNIQQTQRLVQKMKENAAVNDKQMIRIRQQYLNKEKMLKMQMDKYHKQNEVLKIKSKNEEQRCKNSENRLKETLKQIESKNELIRQKDKTIRQKEHLWNNKNNLQLSRVKELQHELKNSRHNDTANKNQEQPKKNRQIKQMLEMSIKKNQELKDKNYELQMQLQKFKIKKIQDEKKNNSYSASLANGHYRTGSSGQRKSLLQQQKLDTNHSSLFMPESIKIQTVTSYEYMNSPKKQQFQGQALKEINVSSNKYQRKQAYVQIKNLFNTVSEDMGILQERLKENSVIQKVYLKQLERKRNQNKTLKKQIQSMKVYAGHAKNTSQLNRSISHKINIEKEKTDSVTQNSGTNAATEVSKGQQNIYVSKKKSKN